MTYSNGIFNPNPFSNPFNSGLGPSNYSYNPCGVSYSSSRVDMSKTKLPDPLMLGDPRLNIISQDASELVVPNQLDAPVPGQHQIDKFQMQMQNKDIYVAPDGTIFDLNSRKVISQQNGNCSKDEWASCKVIQRPSICGEWNDVEINRLPSHPRIDAQIDKASQDYWHQIDNSRACQGDAMSDLQKELLADLEAGNFVGHSRLIDEI